MSGLAAIARTKAGAPSRWRPRSALAAAVSHSSMRPRVAASRTRVRPIACTLSQAWLARNVSCRPVCARAVVASSRITRRKTRQGCWVGGPPRVLRASGIEAEGERGQDRGRPEPGASRENRPREQQQGHGRGRHQAPPQVVEDLPAGDERQAVAAEAGAGGHDREEPPQDLPVAAHPAVLAARVGEDAGRVVVHHLDVGDQGRARVQPLEEVVREESVLRHAPLEGGDEGVHVVEPLAGEDPLGEEVLVRVGDRGRVGVDAGVTGVQAREERAGGARHGHAHPGLEDPVALGDPPETRVEVGLVERVGGDADQLLRGVAGQARVGVEGDAVADGGEDRGVSGLHREARVRGSPQQAVPLLDLAALALPAHPHALGRVPLPHAVGEVEAVAAALGVACVEGRDAGARGVEDRLVLRHLARGGVREIAEDREVDARIEVAQRQHLEVLEQLRARSTLVSSVGTTTIVRAPSGTPPRKSRRGSRRGGAKRADRLWTTAIATSLAGSSRRSATQASGHDEPACRRA